jgi:hypothetical protein
MRSIALSHVVLGLVLAGCSSIPTSPHEEHSPVPPGAASADPASSPVATRLPFEPSNAPFAVEVRSLADVTVTARCEVDGAQATLCGERDVQHDVITQADGTSLGVFRMRTLTLRPNARLLVRGDMPVALVASGDVRIDGIVDAAADGDDGFAGGWSGSRTQAGSMRVDDRGRGPGAGSAPDTVSRSGAGGGAFCGRGGGSSGPGSYGQSALVPLVGGSSGGGGFSPGGAGGGAVEIVSGRSLTIGPEGVVHAGGGASMFGGGAGGSGGAILLEAPTVVVRGVVSANGAGGSGNADWGDILPRAGQPALTSAAQAKGGIGPNPGGRGSGGAVADGEAGLFEQIIAGSIGAYAGGGGGGAGRVRIATMSGSAEITGVVSPSRDTGCTTVGVVKGGDARGPSPEPRRDDPPIR